MQTQSPIDYQGFSIYYLSEQSVTIEFGHEISHDLLQRISSFNKALQLRPFPGLQTTVPAYATLSVFYDPLQVIQSTEMRGRDCFDRVQNYLLDFVEAKRDQPNIAVQPITIPVCYGNNFGPDLEEVAALHNLSVQEVINLHTSAIYTVYMIGFVPGFAYMGGMAKQLATPRKATPRQSIAAGSVGIAGQQTGIYPLATPGGWQIIGRTPLTLFDANRQQPALLKAGVEVMFKSIGQHEFEQYFA